MRSPSPGPAQGPTWQMNRLHDGPGPTFVAGQPVWACQDSAWDHCLAALAKELVGSPSRVLLTCRRPLAALADGAALSVLLGPLPAAEAQLYVREQPALSRMIFGNDDAEKKLAEDLLKASRFHPLLMDRLAKLAANEALRPQLRDALDALDAMEKTKDFSRLPDLFATTPGGANELAYLENALATSLDQLLRAASPDARRLLWIIAVANQPEALELVNQLWSGEDRPQHAQLRKIKQMLEELPMLPAELQAQFKEIDTPELRAMLDALPPEGPARPDLSPLLGHLTSVGLVTEERDGAEDANPNLTCHELVRERIRAWMEQHPQDRAELTENAIRLAYAERLEAEFEALQQQNRRDAIEAGSRALVYYVQAEAWDRLGGFASNVVNSTRDSRLLDALIPHLQTAAQSAPEGKPQWQCLGCLADALDIAGRHDTSLPFFEQAAAAFGQGGFDEILIAFVVQAQRNDGAALRQRAFGQIRRALGDEA